MADGHFTAGLRLAATTFTVAPVRPGRIDRAVAGVAMSVAPLAGALLGALLGAALLALAAIPAPPLLTGAAVVALGAGLTRGLHLDGLADTVDALGSYAGPGRALAVMRRPDVGPFGVTTLVLVLLAQVAAVSVLAARPAVAALAAVVTAVATGRLAVSWACRHGVPAARPDGLGALVAGSVRWPALAVGTAGVAAVAVGSVPGRPWQGPVAVVAALAAALLLVRHAVRRFGGVTGDVLGAACEAATTVAFAMLVLG